MQTLEEIKNISFRKASLGGYRPDDVDTFVDDVITTIEQMQREKNDLLKKLEVLAKRIEEYKSDEDCVRTALLSAQKLGDQAIKEAQKQADDITNEAKSNAERIRQESNAYMIEQKNSFMKLHSESAKLRNQLLETYKQHLKMIDNLPTMEIVKDKKADLDAKFPTEPLSSLEKPAAPVQKEDDAATKKAEETVKKTLKEADAKTSPSSKNGNGSSHEKNSTYQNDKKKSDKRFSDLKFGTDFDIMSDSKKKKN